MKNSQKQQLLSDLLLDSSIPLPIINYLDGVMEMCDIYEVDTDRNVDPPSKNPKDVEDLKRGMNKALLLPSADGSGFIMALIRGSSDMCAVSFIAKQNGQPWKYIPIGIKVNTSLWAMRLSNPFEPYRTTGSVEDNQFEALSKWGCSLAELSLRICLDIGRKVLKDNSRENKRRRVTDLSTDELNDSIQDSFNNRLIREEMISDEILRIAYSIESDLISTGAIPGIHYNYLDLITSSRNEINHSNDLILSLKRENDHLKERMNLLEGRRNNHGDN